MPCAAANLAPRRSAHVSSHMLAATAKTKQTARVPPIHQMPVGHPLHRLVEHYQAEHGGGGDAERLTFRIPWVVQPQTGHQSTPGAVRCARGSFRRRAGRRCERAGRPAGTAVRWRRTCRRPSAYGAPGGAAAAARAARLLGLEEQERGITEQQPEAD
jgi:hypothetical protein